LNEGFFWIPSLAGPVSDYTQGLSWLYPFVNGAPPVGWADAIAYMVLPIVLVVSQLYMQQMMTPPTTDPQQASMQSIMKFMPLMFGYFALVVPSGLSLYWFTSNLLAMAQQYFTKTSLNQTPATVGATAGNSSPIPANSVTTDSEEPKKTKNVKSKRRKSRRKR
jgi:YidC/Oxa1 family membrane protein insertase